MNSNEETLLKKHGITYIDKKHVYQLSLERRHFIISNTTPYLAYFKGKYNNLSSWSDTLIMFITKFINLKIIDVKDLFRLEFDWTKQDIFSYNNIFTNSKDIIIDQIKIKLNTNISSTHLMYVLYDIVETYNIEKEFIKIYYIKRPANESLEVRNYFYKRACVSIKEYLIIAKYFSEERTNSFFIGLKKIDKVFKRYFPNHISLLLFENKMSYSAVKSKFMRIFFMNLESNKNKKVVKYILDILTEYYGYKY